MRRAAAGVQRGWPYVAITLFAVGVLVLSGSAPWFTTAALVVLGASSMLLLHGYCRALETGIAAPPSEPR